MIKALKIIKKSIVLITLVALLTCVFFVSSKPKVVHAEVITASLFGVGLLSAFLGSYFLSSGVDLDFSNFDESTVGSFFNDIVSDYENSTSTVNTYFNENGEYIGTEEDLQFILSDESMGYWSMGKDLNAWAESVKDWFVSDRGLSVDVSSSVYNTNAIDFYSGSYTFIPSDYGTISSPLPSAVSFNGTTTIYLTESLVFNCSIVPATGQYNTRYYIDYSFEHISSGTVISSASRDTYNLMSQSLIDEGYTPFGAFTCDVNNNLSFKIYIPNLGKVYFSNLSFEFGQIGDQFDKLLISAEGTLTDGYEDFQNALDQGLSDQAENENAVVGVGVGSVGDALTAEQVKEAILSALAENTLSGSLSGVYEDQATAADELEGEKEFSPTYPSDWVIVNGLEDFFPFCIPWDLYSVIATLNVPPETPKFTYVVSTGGVFEDQEIEVDLSDFDTVAQIFRIMMAIGFLVFLIIKTRDLIRG